MFETRWWWHEDKIARLERVDSGSRDSQKLKVHKKKKSQKEKFTKRKNSMYRKVHKKISTNIRSLQNESTQRQPRVKLIYLLSQEIP